jgi:hypothetical protein
LEMVCVSVRVWRGVSGTICLCWPWTVIFSK